MLALPNTRRKQFIYLIQDYEPGFYPWSSRHALALETLGFPFHAVVNQSTLGDYLFETGDGQFATTGFRQRCTVFEAAVNRRMFHSTHAPAPRPRRVLVYARPTNPRNLLGLAVAALQKAVRDPVFQSGWEFLAIGARGSLPPIPLGGGHVLREAPWQDLDGYAKLLRDSDILLSPMLSPHTDYPVLEMAASGGTAITNIFSTKTTERLSALSPNIIGVPASVAAFASELLKAASAPRPASAELSLPADWDEALGGVDAALLRLLADRAPA